MFFWLFRESFVHCLVYHLFCGANAEVDISRVCFVSSAQFVESIDFVLWYFAHGLAQLLEDEVSPPLTLCVHELSECMIVCGND